ncbi:HEAT repeat domain-containing protein [Tuwongella immobilis]|uniref:HEAT repeat domain-containing protein n=1 Tax=Tuwongella immobilis TaxID=692036 RepID=A0A6C2YW20_9BACT|nr:HEAT repeat domain-containing protein [Tuwongella immobilis]VIP05062.1 pbs lyase heat domain protein repeat-containing protein : PBS lyase HEAT domain protein repeat-containing protein OS=Cyanothece sp. (strain PCC 7822) GN=Cyan7822_4279 PE=4 SV=1: HEAT_2: HEAT_2: HEAT_2: HEAT_2 [Tuwongella immobilis]VTS07480.1 pbs lyase heat domain protein repeat-containing protein : PBS lyase HEAT domain protein repeat-containing protein OS=Cyanothece sp. (strain PCC 7822) GN=Cyan7822_4279 PE=4 SV=1: HEAT_2:
MRMLSTIDEKLVQYAHLFGANRLDPRERYRRLGLVFFGLYLLVMVPIPGFSLLPLTAAYLGVIAIGRAWVKNEKTRTEIARKYVDGDPDSMPDLRGTALVAASQLLLIFPLLFAEVRRDFGWFAAPDDIRFVNWLWFTFDKTYLKALPDVTLLYGISLHDDRIEFASSMGKHLVLFSRLTFDYMLIQGILRVFSIRSTVAETIRALPRDREMILRLGKRALHPLIWALQEGEYSVRVAAARTLGELGDPRALEPLLEALNDSKSTVRQAALESLAKLGCLTSVTPLMPLVHDADDDVRIAVVALLSQMNRPASARVLLGALNDRNPEVRSLAVQGLIHQGDRGSMESLLPMLNDESLEVRAAVAEAIGRLGDALIVERATPQLLAALADPIEPELLRVAAAQTLGQLRIAAAVDPLMATLAEESVALRLASLSALGQLGDRKAVPALLKLTHREDDAEIVAKALQALGQLADDRALPAFLTGLQALEAEVRLAAVLGAAQLGSPKAVPDLLELLADPEFVVRLEVIRCLPQFASDRVVEALQERLPEETTPEIQQAIITALEQIAQANAEESPPTESPGEANGATSVQPSAKVAPPAPESARESGTV